MVTARHGDIIRQLAINHEHRRRLVVGQRNRLVEQRFIGHHALAAARTGIRTDDGVGRGVIDAGGQRVRCKATKNHRMDGANARTSQHGKASLGNHRHVNQHPIAFFDAQIQQNGCHALDFGVQLGKGVDDLLIGFGRDKDQRVLLGSVAQVPIHRVVAQIGGYHPQTIWQTADCCSRRPVEGAASTQSVGIVQTKRPRGLESSGDENRQMHPWRRLLSVDGLVRIIDSRACDRLTQVGGVLPRWLNGSAPAGF